MTAAHRATRASGRGDEARRIRDLLRCALTHDMYPNALLPGEPQLMAEFGASRSAVRDALAMLHAEGLIDRRKGLGTLVVHSKTIVPLAENHGVGDLEPGSMWSGQMRVRLLEWCDAPLPRIAARRMDAEPGERSLRIDYVAVLEGRPLGMATNYVRYPQAGQLAKDQFRTDWYAMLDAAGLEIGETTFVWEAALADQLDEKLLEVPAGAPVMLAEQVIYHPDGRPFDFALARARGDRTAMFSRAARRDA